MSKTNKNLTRFQELIESKLFGYRTSRVWVPLKCMCCTDKYGNHTENSGICFNDTGSIIYKCWSAKCSYSESASYTPGHNISMKFKNFLSAFGIAIPADIQEEITRLAAQNPAKERLNYQIYQKHEYSPIQLPSKFIAYNPETHTAARDYLEARGLDDTDYYVDTSNVWLYIPVYFEGALIGYQSTFLPEKKYLKSTENSNLVYAPEGVIPYEPIIVEGIVDAKSIPFGVAILQSTITPKQAYLFRNKKPYLLPDRNASGFAAIAEKYGWRMIVPDYDEKDSNKAMLKYGRLLLAEKLRAGICDNITDAKLRYKQWSAGWNTKN